MLFRRKSLNPGKFVKWPEGIINSHLIEIDHRNEREYNAQEAQGEARLKIHFP